MLIKEEEYPPFIIKLELFKLIKDMKIKYGIINEAIVKDSNEESIFKLLIAKAYSSILPIEDELKLYFREEDSIEIDEKV